MYKRKLKRRFVMMESLETISQSIFLVLLYYISKILPKDPHPLEFSSLGGDWKIFQLTFPYFYLLYVMYAISGHMKLAGHKPLYISLFQLVDLLHMNRILNTNPFFLSRKKMTKHMFWVRYCWKTGVSQTGIFPHGVCILLVEMDNKSNYQMSSSCVVRC